MESKVADRLRHLRLACVHQPIYGERKKLGDYYGEQVARDDLRHEIMRVSSAYSDVPQIAIDESMHLFDTIRAMLVDIRGRYFEQACYYHVCQIDGLYHYTIEFSGWPTLLSCDAEDTKGTVIFGIPAFSIKDSARDAGAAHQHITEYLSTIKATVLIPSWVPVQHTDESLQWPTAASPSITRFVWCDVPDVGRLINRYHRIGDGPWRQVEYPQGVKTLVSQLPHKQVVPLSHDNGTPTKE